MRRLKARTKLIRCMEAAVICLTMSLTLSVSCFRHEEKNQYIEPLGLYFHIQPTPDTTVMISFGEKKDSIFLNYYETWSNKGGGSYPLYFVVDNTAGKPDIKHIFLDANGFYDVLIPDYTYSVDPYSWVVKINNFSDHVRKFPRIYGETVTDYYVVSVCLGEYDRTMEYSIYDLGSIDDIDSFMKPFVSNPTFVTFPELKKMDVPLDFQENVVNHGVPKETKRFTVTEDTRKTMARAGWLFVDTMDISMEPILEIDKWMVDDHHVLCIIYRLGSGGERTPVNGARYVDAMEFHKLPLCYK